MTVQYAPPIVEAKEQIVSDWQVRRCLDSLGYTKRCGAPTNYKVRVKGHPRWYRVYVYQISNAGTAFLKMKGNNFAVVIDDPREYLPKEVKR